MTLDMVFPKPRAEQFRIYYGANYGTTIKSLHTPVCSMHSAFLPGAFLALCGLKTSPSAGCVLHRQPFPVSGVVPDTSSPFTIKELLVSHPTRCRHRTSPVQSRCDKLPAAERLWCHLHRHGEAGLAAVLPGDERGLHFSKIVSFLSR